MTSENPYVMISASCERDIAWREGDGVAAFGIIIALILAAGLGCYFYYCVRRVEKFYGLDVGRTGIKAMNLILAGCLALIGISVLSTVAIMILYVAGAFLAVDLIALLVRLACRKRKGGRALALWEKIYGSGLLPIAAAALVLAYGFFNMGHIREMRYEILTDDLTEDVRILLLTDIHYDTVQDPDVLKGKIEEMQETRPDFILLGGDIVEEGTSKEKMREVFRLLGGLESRYGTYYVYGNHDKQPYTQDRTYSDDELKDAIESAGITILQDRYVEIGDEILLAGRDDAAWEGTRKRKSTADILQGAGEGKYVIVADHQPIASDENDEQGVDLQLSGHTHAGQIWPAGQFTELMGRLNYGEYQTGGCKVIVSSGVAGWRYPMRTGKHCEYVVIDLQGRLKGAAQGGEQ